MKLIIAAVLLLTGGLAVAAEMMEPDQLADDKRVRKVEVVARSFNPDGSVTAVAVLTFYDGHTERCTQEMDLQKPIGDEVVRLTAKSRECLVEKKNNWLWM